VARPPAPLSFKFRLLNISGGVDDAQAFHWNLGRPVGSSRFLFETQIQSI